MYVFALEACKNGSFLLLVSVVFCYRVESFTCAVVVFPLLPVCLCGADLF